MVRHKETASINNDAYTVSITYRMYIMISKQTVDIIFNIPHDKASDISSPTFLFRDVYG